MPRYMVTTDGSKLLTYTRSGYPQDSAVINTNPLHTETGVALWRLHQYDLATGYLDWASDSHGYIPGNNSPYPAYDGGVVYSGGLDSKISGVSPNFVHIFNKGDGSYVDSIDCDRQVNGENFVMSLAPSSNGPILFARNGRALCFLQSGSITNQYRSENFDFLFHHFVTLNGGKIWYIPGTLISSQTGILRTISNWQSDYWEDDGVDYKLSDAKIEGKETFNPLFDPYAQCWWARYNFDDSPRFGIAKLSIDLQVQAYFRTDFQINRIMPDGHGNLCVTFTGNKWENGFITSLPSPYTGLSSNARFPMTAIVSSNCELGPLAYGGDVPLCSFGDEVVCLGIVDSGSPTVLSISPPVYQRVF